MIEDLAICWGDQTKRLCFKRLEMCKSNQKQPSCKKRNAALEKAMVKKDVKSKVAAKKWL